MLNKIECDSIQPQSDNQALKEGKTTIVVKAMTTNS